MPGPKLPPLCDATSVDTRREGGSAMTGAKTAVEWLASVAPDPEACSQEWETNPLRVALLPAGRLWDVLILPGELGYPTLDVLTRVIDRLGPVLVDFGDARMGFFVPPGTAARWLGTGGAHGGARYVDRGAVPGTDQRRGPLAGPAGRHRHAHRSGAAGTGHARGGGGHRRERGATATTGRTPVTDPGHGPR